MRQPLSRPALGGEKTAKSEANRAIRIARDMGSRVDALEVRIEVLNHVIDEVEGRLDALIGDGDLHGLTITDLHETIKGVSAEMERRKGGRPKKAKPVVDTADPHVEGAAQVEAE